MRKERLEQLKELLETTRKLISIDIYYCIYDTDCIVLYMYPEDGDKDGIHVGDKFVDPTGKLEEVLETERCIHNFIPMDRFGFYLEGNIIPTYDNGELCGAISTAYMPMNQQQLAARELAVQSIYYLIMSIDMKNKYHCNRLYFDYEKQQFPTDAQHFDDFCEKFAPYVHPEDVEGFLAFTDAAKVRERLQSEKMFTMECRLLGVSGDYRWAELIFTRTEEFEASAAEYTTGVYMVRDIHERKSKELDILAKLEKNNRLLFEQSMTDELTKVYNRKGLVWFGSRLLGDARKSGRCIYTMVADLNSLKYINDKFGHEEGDKAIKTVAELLRKAIPDSAIVSRTGGDEFTVLAELDKDSPIPAEAERKLLSAMKAYNEGSGLSYKVEASYGWDLRPASEITNLDDCVNRADNKMYDMKSARKLQSSFSGKAADELNRRFGSEKDSVIILSADGDTRSEIAGLFDGGYLISEAETGEKALRLLHDCSDTALLFIDGADGSGISFVKGLPRSLRDKAFPILLIEREDEAVVDEAFAAGMCDVLVKPYGSPFNRRHVGIMSRLSAANRKLSKMLEQQAVL